MEPSDETFDYDYDDQSLNMLLSLLIRRLDISAKRHLVALFLDSMRITEKQNLLVASKSYIGVRLSDESRNRARELLEHVEMIFFNILPPKQEELYRYSINLRDMLDYDTTPKGYVEFLNLCQHLVQMTGLPFSLEEDFGGLKSWDAWNNAIVNTIEDCKTRFA
jgi:hypothetical protein